MATNINDYEIPLGPTERLETEDVYEDIDVEQTINTRKETHKNIQSNIVRNFFLVIVSICI